MKTFEVRCDDATYEALIEVAGQHLCGPSTFTVMVLRREMRLPWPYEESPLKDDPELLGADDPS